jgi:transposase
MRHGHKTRAGKFNGHKAQVMIDEATEIITNVSVTPGNQVDGESLTDLLETSMVKPGKLIGDTAYGTIPARDIIEEHQITPIAPLPRGNQKGSKFSKYDFKIDFKQESCECPAREISIQTKKVKGHIVEFRFPKQTCNKCSLRDQCTDHGKGRRVYIKPDEERRRLIISQNNTDEFKSLYRSRPKVERKHAHLIRHGLREARYSGKTKTLVQTAFTAAAVNLKRIFTVATGKLCYFSRLQQALLSS